MFFAYAALIWLIFFGLVLLFFKGSNPSQRKSDWISERQTNDYISEPWPESFPQPVVINDSNPELIKDDQIMYEHRLASFIDNTPEFLRFAQQACPDPITLTLKFSMHRAQIKNEMA